MLISILINDFEAAEQQNLPLKKNNWWSANNERVL